MGFLIRGLWSLTLFLALLGILGGYALISDFAHASGPAIGEGAYGTKTVLTGVRDGFHDGSTYEAARSQAEADQAIKDQAAKDQARKDAQKKAQAK